MKKIYLTAILLVFSVLSFAQTTKRDSTKLDSTQVKALAAAASSANADYVPDVIPPSANATSLGKYGDNPVSYYVGLPNTSINLYTIQSKDLSLPISLNYHHGGIKVEEEASNVGLGFSMNSGGVITRTIFGLDDLREKGIPFHQIPAVPETDTYFKNNVIDGLWGTPGVDTQPDIFYYNVGGISGKFILAAGSAFPLQGIPLDKSDVSITCKLLSTGSNPPTFGGSPQYQWEIITANGIKYTFTQQEISVNISATTDTPYTPQYYFNNLSNVPSFGYNSVRSGHQISSWYLTQVYSSNTLNTITLNYDNDAPYYSTSRISVNEVYQKSFLENTGPGCISPATLMNKNSGFHYNATMTRNAYLKSIVFDNGSVEFALSDREDLQQYFPSGNGALTFPLSVNTGDIDDVSAYPSAAKKPQKIQTISVKDATGSLLKKFEFTYSYFNSTVVGTLPINPTFSDNMLKYNNLRLRLDKVQETDNLGTSYLPAHQFRYVGDVFDASGVLTTAVVLPAKTSWAKDYYGYYNGKDYNNTSSYAHIIPALAYPKMIGDKTLSGSYFFTNIGFSNTFALGIDREVDSTYEAYGALSHIYYPTGGHTQFDYGFHKAMGGAGDVEVDLYFATVNSTPPPLVVPTGDNNKYVADIEFRLECSSYVPVPSSACVTSNANEDFSNIWYAKIQSFGNIFRNHLYSDWNNKLCYTQGSNQTCTYVASEFNVPIPTGTHQLSVNTQTPTNGAFNLPVHSASMKYYKYHTTDYKEVVVGGLRIAKITDFTDATNITKTRVFSYTGISGASTAKQLRPPVKYVFGYPEILRVQDEASIYSTGQGWAVGCPVKNWEIEMNAFSLSPLGSAGTGNVIAYDQVSVSEVDASNRPNGYSVFQYHNEKDTFPTSLLFADIPSTPDLANGMLIHQTILDKDKAMIEESIPTISLKTTQSTLYQGMQFLVGGNLTGTALQLAKEYYTIPAQFWFTSGETKRVYNGANYIETVSTSDYASTQHNFMTQQTVVDSKGNTNSTQMAYPAERVASGNDPTGAYALMVNKHIINPVIETKMLFNGFQYAKKLVNYQGWNTNSFFAPLSVQTQVKSTDPLITQVSFLSYDVRANLTQYSLRNGQTTTLTWFGTTLAEKGKTDLLKTHTVGGGSTGTVLSRSMSYDYKPLVGLLTVTDLNGYTVTNAYDGFSRLINVKDPLNYLLKDINYHYANQSALSGLGLTPTNTLNYIISRTAREAQTGTALDSDVDKTSTQISYMDGLGKSLQAEIWKGSPDKTKDIITATALYDVYNRNHKNVLSTPSDGILGAYKATALSLANAFYGDTCAYTQTVFEPSPLNRPVKQFGAGQAWKATNNEKFVAMAYQLAGGGIGRFDIQSDGSVKWTNTYPASSLYSLATTSERGFVTYELKDKLGRVTHKFQQLKEGFTFAITAYVYSDSLNLLRYVISPEAYNQFGSNTEQITSFKESDAVFKESCFGYVYDGQNRPIAKHIPGAGWRYSVFNKNDVEIMFADESDLAKGYWQWRKVDVLSREIMSGIKTGIGSTSRQTLQTAFDNFTGQNYEEISSSGLLGYTNASFPSAYLIADANIMDVKYYDDFVFNTDANYNFQSANAFHSLGVSKGLMTGEIRRNIKTNTWQKMVMYYDYRGKLIQDFHFTNLNKLIRKDYQYRFNGELLKMRIEKKNSANVVLSTKIINLNYDHLGRKVAYTHNGKPIVKLFYDGIGRMVSKKFFPSGTTQGSKQTGIWTDANNWSSGVLPTLADNVTINTGQTITIPSGEKAYAGTLNDKGILKNFGTLNMDKATSADLYTQNYFWHIRGLKGINLDASGNLNNSLFSYRLSYETAGFYDGNIGKQEWKSNIDDKERSFTFNYDGANRINKGLYKGVGTENYSLDSVNYDLNGNIKLLNRKGATNTNYTSFGNVDNLTYTYQSNSNKLSKIQDATTGNADLGDFRDGTNTDDDYDYWLDGSLKKDKNKGIDSLKYNYLKLIERIKFSSGRAINYEYDAGGTKLKKIDSNGETTDYEEDDIYVNNVLYQTSHDEGRINAQGQYEYNINDHLGNLRVSFRDSLGFAVPVQSIFYDPWGLSMKGMQINRNMLNFNRFQYNGKETQLETGFIDLGNRSINPTTGRMLSIDRFSEKYEHLSGFQFAGNNPIRNIDINGDSLFISFKNQNYLYDAGNLYLNGSIYTGKVKGFLKDVVNALKSISSGQEGASMIAELQGSKNVFNISDGKSQFNEKDVIKAHANQFQTDPANSSALQAIISAGRSLAGGSGGTISWNTSGTELPTTNGGQINPVTDLAHEMFHALDSNRGLLDDRRDNGVKRDEWQAVYRENVLRGQLNEPLRTHYIRNVDPSGSFISGTGIRMITPANQPLLPTWYKK